MAIKQESDTDYWNVASSAFSFDDFDDDNKAQSTDLKLSKVLKEKEPELLQYNGLIDTTEHFEDYNTNKSKQFLQFCSEYDEKNASKLAKQFNPFKSAQKVGPKVIKCGPKETVKNMVLGLDYSLQDYKDKNRKFELLKAAVESHDGNVILEVVLYLKDTLKKSIFQREVVNYPDAVNIYLTYLEEDHETDELTNMLLLLDKAEDAAILKYEAAVTVEYPEIKLKWIENCLSTHFQVGSVDSLFLQSVKEHKKLLEDQVNLENNQRNFPVENMLLFEKLTGRKSVVDSSVLSYLVFCCLNCRSNEGIFSYAEKIKSSYNLSKKQYTWSALRALAASEKWEDIDNLFKSKSWLGSTKLQSCIAYSRILEVLFKSGASQEVLNKYVSCVEDTEEKLELAKKFRCHTLVIEILKNSKDRIRLMKYKASLPPHTEAFYIASDILKNNAIKWKN